MANPLPLTFTSGAFLYHVPISNPGMGMYHIKQFLIQSGNWVAKSSGDGFSTYSSTGDILTGFNAGANGTFNTGSWIRLLAPDGQRELVMQLKSKSVSTSQTVDSTFIIKYSKSSTFTAGTPDYTTMPTAGDEQYILGQSSPLALFRFASGTGSLFGGCDTVPPYGFYTVCMGVASNWSPMHGFAMMPVISYHTNEVDPYVFYANGTTSAWTVANMASDGAITDSDTVRGYLPDGGSWRGIKCSNVDSIQSWLTTANTENAGDGASYVACHTWGRSPTDLVTKGWFKFPVHHTDQATAANAMLATYTNEGATGSMYIRARECAFPWDGSVPTSPLSWTAQTTMRIITNPIYVGGVLSSSAAAADTTAPDLLNFSPATGSNISVSQSLSFDIRDLKSAGATGSFRRIVLHIGFPGALSGTEVVHDGEQFDARYYSGSTNVRTVVSASYWYRYTILRDTRWPGTTVRLYPFATDQDGNENA